MPDYAWKTLMTQWNELLFTSEITEDVPEPIRQAHWLGNPGASEAQLHQLERRIGRSLPPSYRDFLRFSNGWGKLNEFIDMLWSTKEVDWFSARYQDWAYDWADGFPEYEFLPTALQISDVGDAAVLLLNPQVVDENGEWEAWFVATWNPEGRSFSSFLELMQHEFEGFVWREENMRDE